MVDVELVVAVHSADRPVERAVGSVLACSRAGVIVVVHNTDVEPIRRRLGPLADDNRLRLLELHDGVHSPAGPFNFGLDAATAPFVGVLGSDDELAPGAVDGWLELQRRHDADVLIARVQDMTTGAFAPTPPVRIPVRHRLDGVRDRLSYRSAPLGMYRSRIFPGLRFTTGLLSGEDIAFVTELWFAPVRRVFDPNGAPYRVHADAGDRVTGAPRAITDDFAFLDALDECADRLGLTVRQRRAIAVKTVRVHVFSALENRPSQWWTAADREELADIVRRVLGSAPGAVAVLSVADRRILDALLDVDRSTADVYALLERRRRRRSPAALLTRSPTAMLRREAPLRFAVASYLRIRGERR